LAMLCYPTVTSGHLAIFNSIFKDTWKCFANWPFCKDTWQQHVISLYI